jgi:hypothetical protein
VILAAPALLKDRGPPGVSQVTAYARYLWQETPMRSNLTAGVIAGLVAGVGFGILMTLMRAPTPEGGSMPMMVMVAQVVGSTSLAVGWLYHLFNSAVIGALFGWMLGNRVGGLGSASLWGGAYGAAWWVLGGLILMPVFLGMPAFAPLRMPMMRSVAWGSLVGHLVFGVILGAAFGPLKRSAPDAALGTPRHV